MIMITNLGGRMKNIIISIIISIALITSVYLYTERTRYDISNKTDYTVFKIDHITGQVWYVSGNGYGVLIKRKKN